MATAPRNEAWAPLPGIASMGPGRIKYAGFASRDASGPPSDRCSRRRPAGSPFHPPEKGSVNRVRLAARRIRSSEELRLGPGVDESLREALAVETDRVPQRDQGLVVRETIALITASLRESRGRIRPPVTVFDRAGRHHRSDRRGLVLRQFAHSDTETGGHCFQQLLVPVGTVFSGDRQTVSKGTSAVRTGISAAWQRAAAFGRWAMAHGHTLRYLAVECRTATPIQVPRHL
jgi:hypothetical protein